MSENWFMDLHICEVFLWSSHTYLYHPPCSANCCMHLCLTSCPVSIAMVVTWITGANPWKCTSQKLDLHGKELHRCAQMCTEIMCVWVCVSTCWRRRDLKRWNVCVCVCVCVIVSIWGAKGPGESKCLCACVCVAVRVQFLAAREICRSAICVCECGCARDLERVNVCGCECGCVCVWLMTAWETSREEMCASMSVCV